MSKEKIVLIGAGGHAKVVIDSIISGGKYEIVGMIDKSSSDFTYRGIKVIGSDDDLKEIYQSGVNNAFVCVGYLGKGNIRNQIYTNLKKIGFNVPSIIDETAIIAEDVIIGEGTYIGKSAVLNADSKIGKMNIINTAAVIEHDTIVCDYVHISIGAVVCGGCSIGNNVFIGANATVIQGITINDNSIVGAGVTVIRNIEKNRTVIGINREK